METWWQYLLSGVVGSIMAGGVAAFVAMKVLESTSRHQSKLARKQLKKQKAGLDLQLAEQRNGARLERRINAAADLIAATESLSLCYFQGRDEVTAQTNLALAAMFRWKMNSDDPELSDKIHLAVSAMGNAALDLAQLVDDKGMDRIKARNLVVCKMRFNDAMSALPAKQDGDAVFEEQSEMELIHLSLTDRLGPLGYGGSPMGDDE